MEAVTQEYLREFFTYREDGYLVRKFSAGSAKAGNVASTIDNKGYSRTIINKKNYLSHRMIWLYHYGSLPKQIDHIDANTLNNKLENLRIATQSENQQNTKVRSNNKSGYKGVYWHKQRGKFVAQIRINKKCHKIGVFLCAKEAAQAYNEAATKFFGEFARLNKIAETA